MSRQRAASASSYEQTVGFSRAMRAGAHIAVAGTAPIWPDGHVDPNPIAQARRCWEIALGALGELGGTVGHVVRTRTYITDRSVQAAASQAHWERFAGVRPASTMVVVSGLLDARWLLEVELDAIVN
jgi:enamine deaminase RidA (YjgF/YER057c/UK114 family)